FSWGFRVYSYSGQMRHLGFAHLRGIHRHLRDHEKLSYRFLSVSLDLLQKYSTSLFEGRDNRSRVYASETEGRDNRSRVYASGTEGRDNRSRIYASGTEGTDNRSRVYASGTEGRDNRSRIYASETERRDKRSSAYVSDTRNRNKNAAFDSEDPYSLVKEDGVNVCASLWINSFRDNQKVVNSLSGYLKRFEIWIMAYQKVYADETGSLTHRNEIEKSVMEELLSLRNAVMESRFKWGQRLEFYIRSPKDKLSTAPLSKTKLKYLLSSTQPTPFQDKIVQEVLLMILEPVFESRFSQKSFAFRPGRTAHTAIRYIRSNFAGYLWYLKGDLSTILDGVRVGIVMNALVKEVRDKTVIDLIRSALTTPVIVATPKLEKKKKKKKYLKKKVLKEGEPKPDPYWLLTFFGFAPEEAAKVPAWGHCGVLSPLLANICLNEFDHWMEERMKEFFRPSSTDIIGNEFDPEGNNAWPEFLPTSGPDKTRKMDYIRYGGHILIGVRGPRADAVTIRRQLIDFCERKYGLHLENDNVPIEHITKGIMFLDHVICRRVVYPTLRYTATGGKIVSEKGVGTLLSVTASLNQCIRQFRKLELVKGDRDPDPQPCFRMFHATQAYTNAQMNKLLATMAEWFRYADNRKKVVNFCSYIIRGSLAKLYAAKYKLRSRAQVYKIASHNLGRPLKEKKGSSPHFKELLRMGLVDSIDGLQFTRMSLIPGTDYTPFLKDWRPDHEQILQEYLKLENPKTLQEQQVSLHDQGLIAPQDYMSIMVWNYKKHGILSDQTQQVDSGPSGDNGPKEETDLSDEEEVVVGISRVA
ncbi:hypothetical protein KI387_041473, partial [Taxus chinensis]